MAGLQRSYPDTDTYEGPVWEYNAEIGTLNGPEWLDAVGNALIARAIEVEAALVNETLLWLSIEDLGGSSVPVVGALVRKLRLQWITVREGAARLVPAPSSIATSFGSPLVPQIFIGIGSVLLGLGFLVLTLKFDAKTWGKALDTLTIGLVVVGLIVLWRASK